jgi:hypothetical protein
MFQARRSVYRAPRLAAVRPELGGLNGRSVAQLIEAVGSPSERWPHGPWTDRRIVVGWERKELSDRSQPQVAHRLARPAAGGQRRLEVTQRVEEVADTAAPFDGLHAGNGLAAAPQPPEEALEAAVVFAPAQDLFADALRAVIDGATVVWVSTVPLRTVTVSCPLLVGERRVRSVAGFTRRDLEDLLAFAATMPIRPDVEVVPLIAAEEELARLATGRTTGSAVRQVAAS